MALDPFGATDTLDDAALAVMAERLEARGAAGPFDRLLNNYINRLPLDAAETVIDVGCGTGVSTRAVARTPAFTGTAIGVDLSPFLIRRATELSESLEVAGDIAGRIQFRTGDTKSLAFPDGCADIVIQHTLLSHLTAPEDAIDEALRLLRSGGRLAIFDGDYASWVFGDETEALSRDFSTAIVEGVVTDPTIMRRIPRLIGERDARIEYASADVIADIGVAGYWESAVSSLRGLLPKSGCMTEAKANAWAARQEKAIQDSVFFASCPFYTYIIEKG